MYYIFLTKHCDNKTIENCNNMVQGWLLKSNTCYCGFFYRTQNVVSIRSGKMLNNNISAIKEKKVYLCTVDTTVSTCYFVSQLFLL